MASTLLFKLVAFLLAALVVILNVERVLFPLRFVISRVSLVERKRSAADHRAEIRLKDARIEQLIDNCRDFQEQLANAAKELDLLRGQISSWVKVSDRLKGWVQALDPQAKFYRFCSPDADLCAAIVALKSKVAKRVRFADEVRHDAPRPTAENASQTAADDREVVIAAQREEIKGLQGLLEEMKSESVALSNGRSRAALEQSAQTSLVESELARVAELNERLAASNNLLSASYEQVMIEKRAVVLENHRLHQRVWELTEERAQMVNERSSLIDQANHYVAERSESIRLEAEAEFHRLQQNVSSLQVELAKSRAELAQPIRNVRPHHDDDDNLRLKAECDKSEATVRQLEEERTSLQATIKSVKDEVRQRDETIVQINKDRSKLAHRHNLVREDHAKLDAMVLRLSKEKDDMLAKTNSLKHDNIQLSEQAQLAERKVAQLQDRVTELEAMLQAKPPTSDGDIMMGVEADPNSPAPHSAPSSSSRTREDNVAAAGIDPLVFVSCLHFIAATLSKEIDEGVTHEDLSAVVQERFTSNAQQCSEEIIKLIPVLLSWGCKQTGPAKVLLPRRAGPLPSPMDIWTLLPPKGQFVDTATFLREKFGGQYTLPDDRFDLFRLIGLVAIKQGKQIGRKF